MSNDSFVKAFSSTRAGYRYNAKQGMIRDLIYSKDEIKRL